MDQLCLFVLSSPLWPRAIKMLSIDTGGDSSPDPLGTSQDTLPSVKAKTRSTPPRKALAIATGNAQAHSFHITTPSLQNSKVSSSKVYSGGHENEQSPWQIRITVQAEQNNTSEGFTIPDCSPSKQFAERTFTTTVPLKAEDKSSPVRRTARGTPRKLRGSSGKRRSSSNSSVKGIFKTQTDSSVNNCASKPSPSPKRGRGRPRKSMGSSEVTSSTRQNQKKDWSQQPAPPVNSGRNESVGVADRNQSKGSTYTTKNSMDAEEQDAGLDSIIESEGFSMVSVTSLPSAQVPSGVGAESKFSPIESSLSSSKTRVTPAVTSKLPSPPPLPKVGTAQQSVRELDKPTSGTPRLGRVVRAAIALQGVLSPARQRHTSAALAPWLDHSSPMSSTTSPKERLDELFNGFGPGTRRELRAGLRLGEELAKRQNPETYRAPQQAHEDVFAPHLEIRYPELSDTEKYSLKVPDAVMTRSPSCSNTQLPSPARSEVAVDDDRMSWKFDTLQSNDVKNRLAKVTATAVNFAEDKPSPISQSLLAKEEKFQSEREAVSKQIQQANSSQVIVIEGSDEDETSAEATYDDDGDIWQEEAQNSGARQSTSDIPPIILHKEPKKSRRSQIPSPWMRKTQDVPSSSSARNDFDLFWQSSHAEGHGGKPKRPDQKNTETSISTMSSMYHGSAPNADRVRDDVEEDPISGHSKPTLQSSQSFTMTEAEDCADEKSYQHEQPTTPDESLVCSDSEGPTYKSSDDPLTDDEDIESNLVSHHFMQDDITSPLDEGTIFDIPDVPNTPAGSAADISEVVPEPRTPSCLARTPRASSSKKVRFTAETKKSASVTEIVAPLPPAPSSWFTRVTSLIPTWNSSSAPAAAIPLPTKPKKIIKLSEMDHGPLPSYMPWQPCHWWALIRVNRQLSADPSAYPYDPKSLAASWLGSVVSVNQWAKKITKNDCAVVERFMRILYERGTFRGVEETLLSGGKKQWGKNSGEWIDRRTVLNAAVAQWAVDVQDGVAEIGWGDRAGLKVGGKEGEIWTESDREVDGGEIIYVL
ncbi:MAG: hypothetical protein Q9213_006065 [Squamulea squamosa]